jgi:hypothetical protein
MRYYDKKKGDIKMEDMTFILCFFLRGEQRTYSSKPCVTCLCKFWPLEMMEYQAPINLTYKTYFQSFSYLKTLQKTSHRPKKFHF